MNGLRVLTQTQHQLAADHHSANPGPRLPLTVLKPAELFCSSATEVGQGDGKETGISDGAGREADCSRENVRTTDGTQASRDESMKGFLIFIKFAELYLFQTPHFQEDAPDLCHFLEHAFSYVVFFTRPQPDVNRMPYRCARVRPRCITKL
jgi:hypothetical protein